MQRFKLKYFKVNCYKGEFIRKKRGMLCGRVEEEGGRIKYFSGVVGLFVCLFVWGGGVGFLLFCLVGFLLWHCANSSFLAT